MATDHLGRELDSGRRPQTVAEFAVEQGTVEDTDAVRDAIREDKRRTERGTEHAKRVSQMMAPDPVEQPATAGAETDRE